MKNEVRTDSQKTTIVADSHVFHGEKILNSYVYSITKMVNEHSWIYQCDQ